MSGRTTETDDNSLPNCEGWVCQSCAADNFIPAGFVRITAEALCREYHPMHWDVAYGNRNRPCEACKIHAVRLAAMSTSSGQADPS